MILAAKGNYFSEPLAASFMNITQIVKMNIMKNLILLILTLTLSKANCQSEKTPEVWFKYFTDNFGLDSKEQKNEFKHFDFSELFLKTTSTDVYGVIGENLQRIQFKWISINKDPNNPDNYYVYGKTKVKSNVCGFTGIIKIKTIRLYPDGRYDLPYKSKIQPDKIGVLFCDYILTENTNEKHTGVFSGISATDFYIHNDSLFFNDLRESADDMTNNQFVGYWTSYSNGIPKFCNWGDYRVPNVSGFDCGAAKFSPCDEYEKFGWENFKLANLYLNDSPENDKARKLENEKWWE